MIIHYHFVLGLLSTFAHIFLGQIDCDKEKKNPIKNWIFEIQSKLSF